MVILLSKVLLTLYDLLQSTREFAFLVYICFYIIIYLFIDLFIFNCNLFESLCSRLNISFSVAIECVYFNVSGYQGLTLSGP